MAHWRLTSIKTETDEDIVVNYSSKCTLATAYPADPSANTTLCYPVMWTPPEIRPLSSIISTNMSSRRSSSR